jgi:hypothetical protein
MNLIQKIRLAALRRRRKKIQKKLDWIEKAAPAAIAKLRAAWLRAAIREYELNPDSPFPTVTVAVGEMRFRTWRG